MSEARFQQGERVIVRWQGALERGRVTGVLPKWRRLVTDSGRRLTVPVRRLRPSPDRVLILEARLERNLRRSERIYGPMLQRWLAAYNVESLYERVHTVNDMRRFLQREGRHVATRFIHIIGHGRRQGRRVALELTCERLDLLENLDVFKDLVGKVILFSSCQIGGHRGVMEAIKETSGAAAVIAYRTDVDDSYCNLAEALLYDRLIQTSMKPQKAVELVVEVLDRAGVRISDRITRKPVLVCV